MAKCELGHWFKSPDSGLVRVDYLVRVAPRRSQTGWVLEAETVAGHTIPLLSQIPNEDEADRLYEAVQAFLEDPRSAVYCVEEIEDLPLLYREED